MANETFTLMKMGSTGRTVMALQARLNAVNNNRALATDGVFGNATEAAVKDFQKSVKLKPDGVVGALTFDALWPKPKWEPPARHVVILLTQKEVVDRANLSVGSPVEYHLEYPNGGTNPLAPMPCDEQTGQCDCAGFDAWVQGFDRDFLSNADLEKMRLPHAVGMSRILDKWDGYCNTDSKIEEAESEGKLFSIIPFEDAQPGDMIVAESYKLPSGVCQRRVGHEGTIVATGNWRRDGLKSLQVVHCSPRNVPLNKAGSAIWKTNATIWGQFPKRVVVRFNREYAYARYLTLTGQSTPEPSVAEQ